MDFHKHNNAGKDETLKQVQLGLSPRQVKHPPQHLQLKDNLK